MIRALPLLLVACATDLPTGWEDAERVADFDQAPCEGNPYEDTGDAEVTATAQNGGVNVVAEPVPFRCAQDVEAFWKPDGAGAAMLVQPIDLHPSEVAGCDCLYRVEGLVPVPDADHVAVWRRWDALNDPNDPVLVGEADVAR
jgi:hypothetical protein